ncbi:class I lanthipeptide [Chitinophaga nivalis]|uniref:Class I lanthipeptide n=1 Tax=Chitinophaga nivalis TaxID=2991709 RepID=A0ABT3ILB5_9BACT|nr:class I lanthipeptide [Chitinophaga nivalis]MCW3465547.1 class I lanthipeptide [Chitinophaga nivalis]MCW3484762.1 class I lanthipeptide [Chitinophaga nivalis]
MKKIKLSCRKKLLLNKVTIAALNGEKQRYILGGKRMDLKETSPYECITLVPISQYNSCECPTALDVCRESVDICIEPISGNKTCIQ